MEFCIQKASRSIAVAALTVALGSSATTAYGQAAAGQAAPAQGGTAAPAQAGAAAGAKNWKDRAEYDLYVKITQTQDPKARLDLINQWQDKYPQTDYSKERAQFLEATYGQLAQSDPGSRQKLLDVSKQTLQQDPKDFTALYFTTLYGPMVGGTSPSPDLLAQVDQGAHGVIDNADTKFAASAKPAQLSDADWAKAKNQAVAIAHNALAWEATAKKDPATTDTEYKASLTANPENGLIAYQYAQILQSEKKYPQALFEYARAAQYDGPGAIAADKRPTVLTYFNKLYSEYHGSAEGADQLLAQAKSSALPPDALAITSATDTANAQAATMQKRIDSDPAFKVWYSVKSNLVGDNPDAFFKQMQGAEVPGKAVPGVSNFSGTVLSVDPTKITVGVEDPTKADATLLFDEPADISGVKVGDKIDFSGVADSYTKEPYMLTLKDPTSPSIKEKPGAAPKKPRRRPA